MSRTHLYKHRIWERLTKISTINILVISLTAGVTEELLFRGYATERLDELTGSRVIGALVPTGAFVLSHKSDQWDWAAVTRIVQPATITTALYIRTRDLLALVTVHALNDLIGLLLADKFAEE